MARQKFKSRRSQLVSTFGVGSLFPAENNSFMITSIDQWDRKDMAPALEPRLARSLHVKQLFQPPTGDRSTVPVIRFPQVLSCPACRRLGSMTELKASYQEVLCGLCKDKAPLTPSRFVVACEDGHLDDFPYAFWVHGTYPQDRDDHQLVLQAEGRTSSLADMVVICSCGQRRSMADAFNPSALRELHCTGRRLWLGKAYRQTGCSQPPRTVQRGASNVWFPAIASAISIPPYSEFLAKMVAHRSNTLSQPEALEPASTWVLEAVVKELDGRFSVEDLREEIRRQFHGDVQEEITDEVLRGQEYQALVAGQRESPDTDFVSEIMDVPKKYDTWISGVRKVTRLREVRALYGFTRLKPRTEDSPDVKLAELSPLDNHQNWLPAIETLGEGLFISLDRDKIDAWAASDFVVGRMKTLQRNANKAAKQRKQQSSKVDIVRVLLHTLSHVMIDQLSLDAGYPASSIRERLYVQNGIAGILLYTASSDSAGSLGGIAAQAHADRLASALAEGLDRHSWCSADPVCIESTGAGTDARNLAACHCCVLVPESSCELFNSHLDRGLLVGTPGEAHLGFLGWVNNAPAQSARSIGSARTDGSATQAQTDHSLWAPIFDGSPELHDVITELVELEVTPDQWRATFGASNQWVVDLSWTMKRVAIVVTQKGARDDWLADNGWQVFSLDELDARDTASKVADAL
ncbi:DUF1998 domain-containing protein [Arthrobacter alpinus]|uniref:DUF1998 domain-containing protein n=1 Tax=Arthrobacter alpinus TaxID=656366 RepID=UPI0016442E0B|nr:DUF1998 domain-containing protein [Arthrobacter alpinus]